jgi:hypothetical protein
MQDVRAASVLSADEENSDDEELTVSDLRQKVEPARKAGTKRKSDRPAEQGADSGGPNKHRSQEKGSPRADMATTAVSADAAVAPNQAVHGPSDVAEAASSSRPRETPLGKGGSPVYSCALCGAEFGSGRSLGGHRRHGCASTGGPQRHRGVTAVRKVAACISSESPTSHCRPCKLVRVLSRHSIARVNCARLGAQERGLGSGPVLVGLLDLWWGQVRRKYHHKSSHPESLRLWSLCKLPVRKAV